MRVINRLKYPIDKRSQQTLERNWSTGIHIYIQSFVIKHNTPRRRRRPLILLLSSRRSMFTEVSWRLHQVAVVHERPAFSTPNYAHRNRSVTIIIPACDNDTETFPCRKLTEFQAIQKMASWVGSPMQYIGKITCMPTYEPFFGCMRYYQFIFILRSKLLLIIDDITNTIFVYCMHYLTVNAYGRRN